MSDVIKGKVSNLPRLTPEDIEDTIVREQYHHFPGTTMTTCCLTLKNGYYVTGESACVHPEDFDAALGVKYSRDSAVKKVYDVEAYMLRQRMFVFGK